MRPPAMFNWCSREFPRTGAARASSFSFSCWAATASTSDCRKETALSVCTQSRMPLIGIHRRDPGDVLRPDTQEAQRFGAAQHVAGVRAGAGLYGWRVQGDRAVRVEGDFGLYLPAALFLPLGMPAGMQGKAYSRRLAPS